MLAGQEHLPRAETPGRRAHRPSSEQCSERQVSPRRAGDTSTDAPDRLLSEKTATPSKAASTSTPPAQGASGREPFGRDRHAGSEHVRVLDLGKSTSRSRSQIGNKGWGNRRSGNCVLPAREKRASNYGTSSTEQRQATERVSLSFAATWGNVCFATSRSEADAARRNYTAQVQARE